MTTAAQLNPFPIGVNEATPDAAPRKVFYAKKSDWAQAKADKIEEEIKELERHPVVFGNWQAAKQRERVAGRMIVEAADFRAIARTYRARGK